MDSNQSGQWVDVPAPVMARAAVARPFALDDLAGNGTAVAFLLVAAGFIAGLVLLIAIRQEKGK